MLTSRKPMEELLDAFSNSELQDRVEVRVMGAGLNIEISDNIMFPPASAALTPNGISLLQTLAEALTAQPYQLSIEGHSDNVPIETTRFPSNWELSTARAAVVARHLVKRGISAERIRAIGYADTRPRADNLTPEGRSRNRRVSLVVQIPSRHN
jgi:chemotaxis protein MotB